MPYKPNSIEWLEETICTCGCGHGSGEEHTEWCVWLKVEDREHLANAAFEFLATPGLHKIRVRGKMMSRKEVAVAVSTPNHKHGEK